MYTANNLRPKVDTLLCLTSRLVTESHKATKHIKKLNIDITTKNGIKNLKKVIFDLTSVVNALNDELEDVTVDDNDDGLEVIIKATKISTSSVEVPEFLSNSLPADTSFNYTHVPQLSLVLRIQKTSIERQIYEVSERIDHVLKRILDLSKVELYVCEENSGCGCQNISENAYEAYMHEGHGCHSDERSLPLVDALEKEPIFHDLYSSTREKNAKFIKLYSKYGIGESKMFNDPDYDDLTVEEASLKIRKLTFEGIWQNSDKVLKYHFRNLKPKPKCDMNLAALPVKKTELNLVNRRLYEKSFFEKSLKIKKNYLKYLERKWKGFLEREVWIDTMNGLLFIMDNFVMIDGHSNCLAEFGDTVGGFCTSSNDFLKNYLTFD